MNAWRPIHRDCFPSLHTAVSTLTSLWAWRTRRLHRLGSVVATIYLPLNAALWFATVYLRYHWVVDLLAGWLLAVAVAWAIPPVARRWYALHEGLRKRGQGD
jgi:membrane-associated phospholipid phosphatase